MSRSDDSIGMKDGFDVNGTAVHPPDTEKPGVAVNAERVSDDNSESNDGIALDFVREYKPSNPLSAVLNKVVPHGGLIANAYSMAAVTLGSGIITLPAAFQASGYVTGIIVLVAISVSTVYSMYLLAQAIDKTGRKLCSYEALARTLLGRGWDYLAAFNMWMFCFGSCVSYVISVGDLLSRATDGDSVNSFIRSTWGNRVLVIIIWLFTMLPLSIPKEINSLRYFSVFGVTCMVYFVIVIIVHCALNGFQDGAPIHTIKPFKTGNGALVGFSQFIFAFLCQTNGAAIYRESTKPSPLKIMRDTAVSMTACCTLYILASIFGYLEFGESITGSILLRYDVRNDVMVAISYVCIGIKLIVSFSVCMQPTRDSVYYCLGDIPHPAFRVFKSVKTVPYWLNSLICGFMAVVALVLGLFIPSVTIVFGLVGSFCGGFLGFVYPALFIMYCGQWGLRRVGVFHYVATYLLLIAGVIAIVFGTVAAIYGEI